MHPLLKKILDPPLVTIDFNGILSGQLWSNMMWPCSLTFFILLPSSPFCIGVPVTHHLCTLFRWRATSAAYSMQQRWNSKQTDEIIGSFLVLQTGVITKWHNTKDWKDTEQYSHHNTKLKVLWTTFLHMLLTMYVAKCNLGKVNFKAMLISSFPSYTRGGPMPLAGARRDLYAQLLACSSSQSVVAIACCLRAILCFG